MKKYFALLLLVLPFSSVLAKTPTEVVTREELLTGYFQTLFPTALPPEKMPELLFTDISGKTKLVSALASAVYFDFFPNQKTALHPDLPATRRDVSLLLKAHFGIDISASKTPLLFGEFQQFLLRLSGIKAVSLLRLLSEALPLVRSDALSSQPLFSQLSQTYNLLLSGHYHSDSLSPEKLIYGAAKGMADATGDRWTVFFPPAESQSFHEQLSGEFEGIGAYVDMVKPGDLRIISPIGGSPAEKAGLLPQDRIITIEGNAVTEKLDLASAIAQIKGPKGTKVHFEVVRGEQKISFEIVRAKITVPFVESKKLSPSVGYVRITTFGFGSADAFESAIRPLLQDFLVSRVILDLRNNPGGSLDEVSRMLSLFVTKGEPVVVVKYKNMVENILSEGSATPLLFGGKTFVILTNEGSASASEIMAGTLKDYLPYTCRLVGQKTYGKGSVQTQMDVGGGSSLKYTVAKWFTGKTQTGIDGQGISPDYTVENTGSGTDQQLEFAKNLAF